MKKGVPDQVASLDSGLTGAPHSQPSTLNSQPPLIPDHQLLRCIGRGSYGEVWLARSVLGEYRAVKVIHRRAFGDNRPFEREFEGIQRFEPISRSHESQVQILHVGINEAEGYFYYVMELADDVSVGQASSLPVQRASLPAGQNAKLEASPPAGRMPAPHFNQGSYSPRTLRSLMTPNPQPSTLNSQPTTARLALTQCLEIGLALTTALAHLHKQGLVHRDIKPSNIIFVKGRPKLADIGLVTDVGDAKSIVGTEGYLAPEGPGTAPADIYALGMVLYEISTGRDRRHFPDLPLDLGPPSAERGITECRIAADSALRTPHSKGLLELNEILLKACARDARQRYQSAEEMHADLALLQTGKSVKHKRSMEQLWAFCKKVSLAIVLLALAVAALLTFLRANSRDTSNASYRLSKNPDARKEYEEGVYCYRHDTRDGLRRGLEHFLKAIEFDPEFTMAYNGLFEVYIGGEASGLSPTEEDAKRRAMVKKMMELDNDGTGPLTGRGPRGAGLDRFSGLEMGRRRAAI